MKSDEFVGTLSRLAEEEDKLKEIQENLPLGIDAVNAVVYARREQSLLFSRHTCVIGGNRSEFIRRLLITLSRFYKERELCVFVLSPRMEYGELLRMKGLDITLPYLRSKSDLEFSTHALQELLSLRDSGTGYPRLVVVLDGLEELPDCNRNGDLEEYRAFIELLSRREDVEIITGVELTKSIFSGYPGAFVGIGNCLVATRESGKADVTYVQEDASLTLPMPMTYPDAPSLMETILLFNALAK